jgi:methyl-accepting chemotaxis protein
MGEKQSGDCQVFQNESLAIKRLGKGYYNSVVMGSVTAHSLDIIAKSLDAIGDNLSAIVAAFEEIRATTQNTAGNTDKIESMMDAVVQGDRAMGKDIDARMGEVSTAAAGAQRLSSLFSNLSAKAKDIVSMTGSITDLADRTNILAINASIEAARAGSVGKGFRIIANEVRSLATQTGDFAKSIEGSIDDFQSVERDIEGELSGFSRVMESLSRSFSVILGSYTQNAASLGEAGNFLTQITGSIKEEAQALDSGLHSLEGISESLHDTQVIFGALIKTYAALDRLMKA